MRCGENGQNKKRCISTLHLRAQAGYSLTELLRVIARGGHGPGPSHVALCGHHVGEASRRVALHTTQLIHNRRHSEHHQHLHTNAVSPCALGGSHRVH